MMNPEDIEKARNIQLGLSQFESLHMAVREPDQTDGGGTIICGTCDVDFPCERMLSFMLLQSISAFASMMPTGNMAAMLGRFGNKK